MIPLTSKVYQYNIQTVYIMPKKPNTQAEFKVFVDEHSPDDSKDIEEQWQKAKKQHRNRQLTKVLIAGAIVIGLIFAILLNTLSHTPSHVLLDDSHPKYSYYQTLFPHIKVEVVKNSDSSEAKLMRGVGVLFSEVVSWLEGNTVPSMKVLLIPDEEAGVNMLGMAVGYYLQSALNGRLDILIHTDSYRELTKANLQLMKKEHPQRMPVKIIGDQSQSLPEYDLIILEDSTFTLSPSVKSSSIVVLIKSKTESLPTDRFADYQRYRINKGIKNQDITKIGKWPGYSLTQKKQSDSSSSYQYILLKKSVQGLNLCQEAQTEFIKQPQLRNLVEFLRNKTIEKLYYGLDSNATQEIIATLPQIEKEKVISIPKTQDIKTVFKGLQSSGSHYFIIDQKQAIELANLPKGIVIVLVSSQQEKSKLLELFTSRKPLILPSYNNKGCFYPPHLISDLSYSSGSPFFLVFRDEIPYNDQN